MTQRCHYYFLIILIWGFSMVSWKIGLWRRQSPPFQQIRQHFVRFLFEGESRGRSAGNVVGKNRVSCYCQGQERKRVPYYCLLMLLLQQQQRNVRHWFLLRFQIWCHSIQLSISGIILPNLVSVHFKLYQHLHCCVPLTAKLFLALQNLTSTPDSSARDTHMPRPHSNSILLSLPNKTQSQTNAHWKIQSNPNCIHACGSVSETEV